MQNCIRPENIRKFGLEKQSPSNIEDMLMLPFHSTILFRGLNTRSLMNNTL